LAIAESTNSQTPIKSRDLRSNDDIQKKLEAAFEGMGMFYERKLNQHSDQLKSLRIDALSAGQAHLAYGLELPEVAKKDRGRIFSDLYDQVFTDELLADELLNALKVLNVIECEKKILQVSIRSQTSFDKSKLYLIDGAYHVLFAVGQICDCRVIDRLEFNGVKGIVPDAIRYVSELVEIEQQKDPTFSFNRFLKTRRLKLKLHPIFNSQSMISITCNKNV